MPMVHRKKLGFEMAVALFCAGLNGCAGEGDGPADLPDGGQGSGDGGEVVDVPVTIAIGTRTALVAVRNADEPAWRQVPLDGQSEVEVMVHGAYEVTMVCASEDPEGTVNAYRISRTTSEDRRLERGCGSSALWLEASSWARAGSSSAPMARR